VPRETGLDYLVTTPAAKQIPVASAFAYFNLSLPTLFTGQLHDRGVHYADKWLPFAKKMGEVAQSHPHDGTRVFAATVMGGYMPFEAMMFHKDWAWYARRVSLN
jgi:hypothetical protein